VRKRMKFKEIRSISETGNRGNFLIHPLVLFISVWGTCFVLYAMHLSDLLNFTTGQVGRIVQWILIPYVVTVLLFQTFCWLAPKKPSEAKGGMDDEEYLRAIETKIHKWFILWCVLTVVEVVASGGLPILWLMQGGSKDYTAFGLPVLHVFLGSLLSVLALSEVGIFVLHGDKRRLLIPAWVLLWSMLVVSRAVMITSMLQWSVLWFFLKGARIGTILRTVASSLAVIFIFGYLGDSRTGGEGFRALARPSWNYPDWLPSGFLWVYIYVTTPLGNLVNTSLQTTPLNSVLFPNTIYFLFPTVIRGVIYGTDTTFATGGDLVTESFNVSTAYIGPYRDFGHLGMVCFSALLGFIAAYYWRHRKTFRDGLIYTIVAQCLLFSIFTNFLFYNPFLGQVFWIYFLFRTPKSSAGIESVDSPSAV
jgi:oligosaccharide repeat unit polymerase